MVLTTCLANEEDPCRMLFARRGRQPKLRFCLKIEVCDIFLSFRIKYTGSSLQDEVASKKLGFPHVANGNRHSHAVFTRRLGLLEP